MLLYAPDDPRPIHFVGIAGAGMSALALIARRRGVAVTGCDADLSGAADVAAAGARLVRGHDPEHVVGARAVVYTAAVASQHPELVAARAAGLPVIRRADALHLLVGGGAGGGNARVAGDRLYVVEADEYDRAFLALQPTIAVVNNVEVDHLECYDGSVAGLGAAFAEFAGRARPARFGADDPGATRGARQVTVRRWLVGTAATADLRITEVKRDRLGS